MRRSRQLNRRDFLGSTAMSLPAAVVAATAPASLCAAEATGEVTKNLARWLVSSRFSDIPASVCKEARRTLLNWVGCAVGGSREGAVTAALESVGPFSGPAQAGLLGRSERLDVMHATLINGIASHVLDYDDTHLRTIIHPAGPVAPGLLAWSEYRPVTGPEFLHALILGIEVECRIGNAVYPSHYDTGWHITGTTGVFGAAAAIGKLLKLSEQQMAWALSLAAVQPVGLREMFGSMTKSFHVGRAAQNGVEAAVLASRNFTSSEQALEAKSGWANVLSTARNYAEITGKLGESWQVSLNTYKPFACGIVMHPTIDGCIQLSREQSLAKNPDSVKSIALQIHPLVQELTGKKSPGTGLDGKFSIYHAAAVAIVEQAGGEQQFTNRAVTVPAVVALRQRVTTSIDRSLAEDQVRIRITLSDGRTLERFVDHAVGSLQHPMSDADLERKFSGLAEGILPAEQSRRVMDLCWNITNSSNAAGIANAAQVG